MKKILIYIIPVLLFAFWSCDQMDDVYDELDEIKAPYSTSVDYVFTADDYATAVGYAKKDAVSLGDADSSIAKLIGSMKAFNATYSAEDYVGKVIGDLYPEYNKGSNAFVTYNTIADMPDDLTMYSNPKSFVFDADAYVEISTLVGEVGYFFPDYNPELYIKEVLPTLITDAVEGDIYRINYMYSNVNPVVPETAPVEVYVEPFTTDLSGVDTVSIIGDGQKWKQDSYNSDTYAKMSGYAGGSQPNEDWLILPAIDISSGVNTFLNIYQAINYLNDSAYQLDIMVSTDYVADVTIATWTSIKENINMPSGDSWTFVESVGSLNDYAGQTIYVAFKYTSSANNAATWEIANISITEGDEILEGESNELNDIYQLKDGLWNKMLNVHYLNSMDYNAMGAPGSYNSFSSSALPQDYLPKYLDDLYPTAGEGASAIVVYDYYSALDSTITLATQFDYTGGEWVSIYDYIETTTNQFIHNGELWLFDPTITYVLTGDDYQIMVDWVIENKDAEYIGYDSRRESYFGINAKYSSYSIYDGGYEGEDFDTWQDAVKESFRQTNLLPQIFPDATTQVNGVDLYYNIVIGAYDGPTTPYIIRYQVTKSGPNPEFEYVEGPTVQ